MNFWRLVHSLVRHTHSEAEDVRCSQVAEWFLENCVQISKVCRDIDGIELDIMGVLLEFSCEYNDLPSLPMVKELLQKRDRADVLLDEFNAYDEVISELNIFGPADLSQGLADKTNDYETECMNNALKIMNTIVNGSREDPRTHKKQAGPKDAVNYFMERLEAGIIIARSTVNHPIIVQVEAKEIGHYYDQALKRGHFNTGFPDMPLDHADYLGVLGYKGGGKSTVSRFMAYNMACQGKSILHISLENADVI